MANDNADDRERIQQLTEAWDEYDNTGDVTVVEDILAEDVVFMPPGESPIVGKENAIEWMAPHTEDRDWDIDQRPEDIFVSGDLAVVRIAITGTRVPEESDEPVDVSTKVVDVYRKDAEEGWKHIISIWNDEA